MPPNIPAETKQQIVAQNIQEEQQKLVAEGNLEALKPEVVTQSAADAAIVTGKTETISKAAEDVTGVAKEEVKKEAEEKKQVLEAITSGPPVPRLEEQLTPPAEEQPAEEESKKKEKEPELVASGLRKRRWTDRGRNKKLLLPHPIAEETLKKVRIILEPPTKKYPAGVYIYAIIIINLKKLLDHRIKFMG